MDEKPDVKNQDGNIGAVMVDKPTGNEFFMELKWYSLPTNRSTDEIGDKANALLVEFSQWAIEQ